jgi:hypothetical protein
MRRAYDLLRGYVNREWERIHGLERDFAEAELNDALQNPIRPSRTQTTERTLSTDQTPENMEHARRVLGVGPNDKYAEIRKSFTKLNRRSDPANFPANSAEARQAAEVQKLVHWAYTVLTQEVDATQRRFGSLEIE